MNPSAPDLQAPVLLLAMPQVLDPFFHRSVVLLLHHTEEGSFGFIVNRPTEILLAEILGGMELTWGGTDDALAFFGGPVQSQMGTVMFTLGAGAAIAVDRMEAVNEVCPGVLITQQMQDLGLLAGDPPPSFRLFLGYAGWGQGQLVAEIIRNDWLMAPVQNHLLFSDRPDTVWERALESVGVDPAALPAWTPPGEEEKAN